MRRRQARARWPLNKFGQGQSGRAMKAFIAALLFAAVAAVGVSVVLSAIQEPSSVAFTTTGARVGDPGTNLIGPQS
jgi:Na+-driven multidrug efflux pump